jgi:lipid-binding SYLF domain-containing protein
MRRLLLAVAALLLLAPGVARAQNVEQTLVDRATLSLQEMMTSRTSQDPHDMLHRARAVMICPRIFKAGFFFGGSGGDCVLLARAGNGTWSYPAFYAIGSGSFGLQIGIQDSSVVMMIMTNRGLNAVMDSQVKLGAGAGLALATIGAGVQGDTTTAIGADIVAFAQSRGLFAGISLEGSVLSLRSGWNAAYYGQPYAARQIVVQMMGANPGSDPLREVLTRYGSRPAQAAVPPYGGPPGYEGRPGYGGQQPGYGAPQPGYGGQQSGYGGQQAYEAQGGYGSQGANGAPAGYGGQGRYGTGPVQTGPGYAPAYPPINQAPSDQAPVQLQPNAPIQQQTLQPPR